LAGDLTVDKKVVVDGNSIHLTDVSGLPLPGANSERARPVAGSAVGWRQQANRVQREAHVFYLVFKHSRTRWYARLLAVCTAGYLLSPIQLIPSFIPVIGFLDDFAVLFLGAKLLQRITPPDVFTECRELADVAEIRRNEKVRSPAALVASVIIATVWLLAAITASALVAKYIRH
jgi:uncharacterized membrane protein YkvA (DUF1232 family)